MLGIKKLVLAIIATTSMCMAFSANAENGLATQSNQTIIANGNFIGNGTLLDFRGGKVLWASSSKKIYISDSSGTTNEEIGDVSSQCQNGVWFGLYTGEKKAIVVCLVEEKVLNVDNGSITNAVNGYSQWGYPNGIATDGEYIYVSRFVFADVVRFKNGSTPETIKELYYSPDGGSLEVDGNTQFIHEQSSTAPYKQILRMTSWDPGQYFGEENATTHSISAKNGKVIVVASNQFSQLQAREYDYSGNLLRVIGGTNEFNKVLYEKQAITPPTPPPEPVQSVINGLTCDEVVIPEPENAVWNTDFGKLPLYSTSSGTEANGERWIQTTSVSNDRRSFDTVRLQNIGDGSDLPIGSIGYPGNDYANVNLNNSADTSITVQSKRDGALAKWNLLQFHGVNQQGFQSWSASSVVRVGGQYLEGQGLSATGGVATLAVAGNNLADTASIFTPVSGFSGIRIGYATPTKKKYCSAQSNKCEWSYEGGSLLCQGVPTPDGLISGSCGISGSGSIYGSGSCVPLTNASGSVVEVDLPGSYTIVQNPDGTTTKVKITPINSGNSIFSCNITGESWYERLGQYAICPFNQMLPKLWDYIYSPIKQISHATTPVSTEGNGGIGLVGEGAEKSNNPLIQGFSGAIEGFVADNEHPIPRIAKLVVACIGIFMVALMVSAVVLVIRN